ncbi:MAG: DUF2207 domain-containing protein [Patescibacteria group bacterium]|nr:DUF2207 domain-containing protein [Patescibacteria group bacterium]
MKKIYFLIFMIFCLFPTFAKARDVSKITDWYIKDFQSEINVNSDSSLLIKETILADCGNLPDKHGIFRILPTFYKPSDNTKVETPIELKSITDQNGDKLHYSASQDYNNGTITWKIGDSNKTVQGENIYVLTYLVKNTIRFGNSNFDEFYWNLNGNYWQIPTDHFKAKINFPAEINKGNTETYLYSGYSGAKTNEFSTFSWTNPSTLQVESTKELKKEQGITLSVTFPKTVIAPYKPTFWEIYGQWLFFLIPIVIFIYGLKIWKKYGRDIKLGRTIMAEYDIPNGLKPLELGMLFSNGMLNNSYVTAAIINLAVNGHLKIEQLEKTSIFSRKDFTLIKLNSKNSLTVIEKKILDSLFSEKQEVKISELQNEFYKNISDIKKLGIKFLTDEKYFETRGFLWQKITGISGILFFAIGIFLASLPTKFPSIAIILSGIILFIFAGLMTKRTKKGAETYWKTEGFRLFIQMTEKYRQQFNEKENIFEKILPYAMIFGLTRTWINNMKKIYGENYFSTYHPVWFYGAGISSFDVDSFSSTIESLSSSMNSAVSPSGSSGGGGAGGGGGGGGGGGW